MNALPEQSSREPSIIPSRLDTPRTSRRAFVGRPSSRSGTLNIFSKDFYAFPSSLSSSRAAQPDQRTFRGHHNDESNATREFPAGGLQHVAPAVHREHPHGIRHITDASGSKQHVQVVGVTKAYKDPSNLPPMHTGIRCTDHSAESPAMAAVFRRAPHLEEESGRLGPGWRRSLVGRHTPRPGLVRDYTMTERFGQVVCEHVRQRTRGVTDFYVSLTRGLIGEARVRAPVPVVRVRALEDPPEVHHLTLRSCHDQLVSLTSIYVSLQELAQLLWDVSSIDPSIWEDDEALGALHVTYRDFSVAFTEGRGVGVN